MPLKPQNRPKTAPKIIKFQQKSVFFDPGRPNLVNLPHFKGNKIQGFIFLTLQTIFDPLDIPFWLQKRQKNALKITKFQLNLAFFDPGGPNLVNLPHFKGNKIQGFIFLTLQTIFDPLDIPFWLQKRQKNALKITKFQLNLAFFDPGGPNLVNLPHFKGNKIQGFIFLTLQTIYDPLDIPFWLQNRQENALKITIFQLNLSSFTHGPKFVPFTQFLRVWKFQGIYL